MSIGAAAALIAGFGIAVQSSVAAGSITSAVSLSAPASGVYGSTAALSGRLWRYGTPYGISGAMVWLQRQPRSGGAWSNLASATTASTGGYRIAVTLAGAYNYRAYYAGSAAFRAAVSPVRTPSVTQRVLFDSIATTNQSAGTLRAVGTVYPLPADGSVGYLQRWDPAVRVWHTVGGGRTVSGRITISVNRPPSISSYRLVLAARSPWGVGVSPTVGHTHYVWRGLFTRSIKGNQGRGYFWPQDKTTTGNAWVNVAGGANSYLTLWINPSGCRAAAVAATASSNPGPVKIELVPPTGEPASVTLSTSTSGRVSRTLDPRWTELYLKTTAFGDHADLSESVALLCTS